MTPQEHAAEAEALLAKYETAPFPNILVQAQVHATLASRPAGADLVSADLFYEAEKAREHAQATSRGYLDVLEAVSRELNQYGQEFSGPWLDLPAVVRQVMEQAYNTDAGGAR